MGAPGEKKLALDTNFLLDLAADEDFAHTFREVFQGKSYLLCVPPTAIQEIAYAAFEKTGAIQALASRSLTCMREWNIQPFDLVAVGHGITEQFTRRLIKRRLLPEDEVNDGQILAETSLAGIPALVTSDKHLLNMDEDELKEAFESSDLNPVIPCHPKKLYKALGLK
jgi:predicted nucleic acid-binding protein